MDKSKIVGKADIACKGSGSEWSDLKRIVFSFHDFKSLPCEHGKMSLSSPLRCHGHLWNVRMYPGGEKDKKYVTVYVCRIWEGGDNSSQVKANIFLRIPTTYSRSNHGMWNVDNKTFTCEKPGVGWPTFLPRNEMYHYLNEGTLTLEVGLQVLKNNPSRDYAFKASLWKPSPTLGKDILRLLESGDLADVTFTVGLETFSAHRAVLASRAPALADLVRDTPTGAVVSLDDGNRIDPSIFRSLLRFVYGEELPPPEDLKRDARALLEAANRFGCVRLKLAAESAIVYEGIAVSTAAELVLFAEAHDCALLKEVAVDFFVDRAAEVMASEGWSVLTESASTVLELTEALARRSTSLEREETTDDIERMRVVTLRRKLDDKNLEVDGSRTILVKRLKTASS